MGSVPGFICTFILGGFRAPLTIPGPRYIRVPGSYLLRKRDSEEAAGHPSGASRVSGTLTAGITEAVMVPLQQPTDQLWVVRGRGRQLREPCWSVCSTTARPSGPRALPFCEEPRLMQPRPAHLITRCQTPVRAISADGLSGGCVCGITNCTGHESQAVGLTSPVMWRSQSKSGCGGSPWHRSRLRSDQT